MRNIIRLFAVLLTSLPLFAAAPYEYSPVFTNLTLISTPGLANRVTSLVGGGVVTNLYTGSLNGLAGTFIWNPAGEISTWDGVDVLDKRIASPVNATHTPGNGTLATATYYYRVSALTALGETVPSTETSLALTGPAGVNVNWAGVPGATGYKVYGRSTGAELLIAQVGIVHTYLDTGAITPSGAMPATNSTMGVIGTWNRHFIKVFGKSPQSGDLTNDFPNLSLVPIITAAGPIGSTTTTPVITYDAKGRLTTVTSATIAYPGSFSGFANPTATVGATAVNGSATTAMRSDAAPAINPVLVVGTSVTSPAIVGTTSITDNGLTATRVTFAGTAGLLSDDADMTFATDTLTVTKLITSTSFTDSGLTAARFVLADTGGLLATDSDFTWATDTASFTKVLAPTSVSTPAIITASGALTVTPAAGSGIDMVMTTADLDVRSTATVLMTVGASGAQDLSRILFDSSGSSGTGRAELSINSKAGVAARVLFKQAGTDIWLFGPGAASDGTNLEIFANQTGKNFYFTTVGDAFLPGLMSAESGHIGGASDPGANNFTVDGATLTTTLTITSGTVLSNATASTAAVFDAGKALISSVTTLAELAFLSGVTSSVQTQLSARTREPKYDTGDPNFLGTTGDDDGQMFMNTSTGEKWHWYAAGGYWTP